MRGATVMIILIKVCVIGKCAQTSNNNNNLPSKATAAAITSQHCAPPGLGSYKPRQRQSDTEVNNVPP